MKKGNLIVGLDVGTTKVCAVVGEVHAVRESERGIVSNGGNGNGSRPSALRQVDIVGIGSAPSRGMKKGSIVNIESTVESIKKAVEEAEAMAGIDIKAVHVGIAGGHVSSFQSNGVIAVKEKDISRHEIDRVIDAAKAVAIPLDRRVLHVMTTGFVVDGQNGISDPGGMSGVRLEANVRIITGAVTPVQNLVKSCQRAGLHVLDIVFDPLASAEAVLNRDEKEVGAGIVDIGGGTTGIALFHGGNICHTSVLTLGGNNFTNDVAIGLRVPASEAEKIKKTGACSLLSMTDREEEVSISYPGSKSGRKIPKRHLVEILQPRTEELLYLVKDELVRSGLHGLMTSGIALTGGAAMLKGVDVMAENIFELPVRIGSPAGVGGIRNITDNPVYATGVGLVLHGAKDVTAPRTSGNGNMLHGVRSKMKNWLSKCRF